MPSPEPLEDRLKAVEAEIADLEEQVTEILGVHDGLYVSGQPIPIEGRFTQKRLEELYRELNNARQRQLSILLTSISKSSNRLEAATKNLKESSESQVEVTKKLLWSSNRLEKISLLLLVVAAATITVIVQNQLVFPIPLLLVAAVFILLFFALRTPWEKDKPK